MTDEMKVMEVLGSEEGTTLMTEYAKLYLKKHQPDLADNEDAVKLVILNIMEQYSNKTYPDGCDYSSRILTGLRSSIDDLKREDVVPPPPERIPPRPYSYSHHNPQKEEKTVPAGSKPRNKVELPEDSRSKAELLEERKKNLIRGVIWLILFWPVGVYFLVKAHQIDSEILNL